MLDFKVTGFRVAVLPGCLESIWLDLYKPYMIQRRMRNGKKEMNLFRLHSLLYCKAVVVIAAAKNKMNGFSVHNSALIRPGQPGLMR